MAGCGALAAAGVVVMFRLAMRADLITETGQMAQHPLPDGGMAVLNTNSALALDFALGRRKIRLLKGEAGRRQLCLRSGAGGSCRGQPLRPALRL